jgi:translation elongation factor EF-Tu-like GTPase
VGAEAVTGLPLAAFIEADIDLLPPEQGGRQSGIWTGYRCNFWIGHVDVKGERTYNDATVYLLEADALPPGATGRARIQPHHPDEWSDVVVGATFELCEGLRVIGYAHVASLFPAP